MLKYIYDNTEIYEVSQHINDMEDKGYVGCFG